MDITKTKDVSDAISGSTSRFQLWQQLFELADAKTVAEVGVWKGDFAEHILGSCSSVEKYYMIDPWASLPDWNKPANVSSEKFEHIYAEAIAKVAFASEKVTVLRGKTKDVIPEIPDNSLDFVYVDGDHTLRGITIDLIKLFPKVKENGFIAGDDFMPKPWKHDIRFEPTLVCPFAIYFAEAMDVPILALPFNQFLIQKKVNAEFAFVDSTGQYGDVSLNDLPPQPPSPGIKKKLKESIKKIGLIR